MLPTPASAHPTPDDAAPGANLLPLLCDAAPHTIKSITTRSGMSNADVHEALERLAGAGVEFRQRDAHVVQLADACVALDAATVRAALAAARRNIEVQVVALVDSTNTRLLDAARAARLPPRPLLLAAEFQSAGRGRLGRAWHARPGAALTVSFAWPLPLGLARLGGLSLVCGLAVRGVLAAHGIEATLKWPNDVLVSGRKIAGILIEAHAQGERATLVVIGIGINVAHDERRNQRLDVGSLGATDMASQSGSQGSGAGMIDRNALLADLAIALDQRLEGFVAHGFAPFVPLWNAAHAWRDRPVRWTEQDRALTGIARGVDSNGALRIDGVVETSSDTSAQHSGSDGAGGMRYIVSGEISLRPLD